MKQPCIRLPHFPAAMVLLACATSAVAANYATYIGDAHSYQVTAIATDASGNTYVTGGRAILISQPFSPPVTDVFVSKLDPSGNLTLLATFAGKGTDRANSIAVDPSGNVYVAGTTTSRDFPLHNPLQAVPCYGQAISFSSQTGFLVKLRPDGGVLYSTYFGGTTGPSSLNAVAADSNGNVYVTGETFAEDYPHTAGLPPAVVGWPAISGALFAKIASAGDKILYSGTLSTTEHACGSGSTCFLSTITTSGSSIAVDPVGNAYIAGNTYGVGLPTTPAVLRPEGIGAFVAKVNSAGTGFAYLTMLGQANYLPGGGPAPRSQPGNFAYAIAADAAGNAYVSGSTSDPAFPATPSAVQKTLSTQPVDPFTAPPSDAFVAKLNPAGSAMAWATFLGGNGVDQAQTIAVDATGDVWVSGVTQSTDFPRSAGWPSGNEFLVAFNSSGTALDYSGLFPSNTAAAALAVDPAGTVHTAGGTGLISTFARGAAPGQTPASHIFGIGNAAGGVLAGRIAPGELISIYGLHLGPATPITATFNSAGFLPDKLGGVQVTINGVSAPLLYVSDTQINAVAPKDLVIGSSELRLTRDGVATADFRVVVDLAAPQVFRQSNHTAAINQDGTVNSPANPAKAGSYVSAWATGTGFFSGADGQMATAAESFCSCAIYSYFETGTDIVVSYAGAAPGTVNGVVQINFRLPERMGSDTYYLAVNGIYSDTFSIFAVP